MPDAASLIEQSGCLKAEDGSCLLLRIYVQPKSAKNMISGIHEQALKVKVNAPPVDGKANKQVIQLFAKMLSLPKSNVLLVSGKQSRNKTLRIKGVTADKAKEVFAANFKNSLGGF